MTTAAATSIDSTVDGLALAVDVYETDLTPPRAVVQIAHGVAEHAARYERLANALIGSGFTVYVNDHRGHGRSTNDDARHGGFGAAGFPALITDMGTIADRIRADHPDVPLFLIAHSMGSFAAQRLIEDRSDLYAGVVLTGSTSLDVLAQAMAAQPSDGPVGLAAFNAAFDDRTDYEWLSRDHDEVDKYVADPWSGFDLDDDAIPQMFAVAPALADADALAGIRDDLPILIVSGERDPLAGGGQLVELLGQRYRDAGVADVTVQVYPDARHEVFNETNRDEITEFVVDWVDAHVPDRQ